MFFSFAGSLIVSRSNSLGVVIVGQCVSGVSQSSLGLIHTMMSEILPRKYRPVAQSAIHMTGSLGAAVALYAGGALCQHSSEGFRTYFYMTAAIVFVVAAGVTLFYHPPARKLQHLSTMERFRSLDVVGYVLLVVGLLGLCVALAWSQNPYGWKNAHVLVTLLIISSNLRHLHQQRRTHTPRAVQKRCQLRRGRYLHALRRHHLLRSLKLLWL